MQVLDVGAGIGGPLMEIAAFSGAEIVGLNNNDYQVDRGNYLLEQNQHFSKCKMVKGDFMELPFESESFDHVYQIEATCHAPDTQAAFSEILRVLKPGGKFASYEWGLTDKFDENNTAHNRMKENIMVGNGLPDVRPTHAVLQVRSCSAREKQPILSLWKGKF